MKYILANILATIVLVIIAGALIWFSPINPSNQLGLSIVLLIIVLYCWYTWQPQENGKLTIRSWAWQALIFLVWILILPLIFALMYRLSYLELLTFHFETFKKVDYIGRILLVIGPPLLVIALVSMIRGVIIKTLTGFVASFPSVQLLLHRHARTRRMSSSSLVAGVVAWRRG
ncbi:MAG: hypothetical protein NTY53_18975 [Kiritimatiellaeota bacterium]|nr:hypothetical protein [Kiritimatiellota bacterium]